MQIHAAAAKHREMPQRLTGFIGLRFNLMQLGYDPMLQGAKTRREGILDLVFIPFALGQREYLFLNFWRW